MTMRDRFVEMMEEEKRTLHFFSSTGSRLLRAEGYDPVTDITDQTVAESKRRIAMYEALIAKVDEGSEE